MSLFWLVGGVWGSTYLFNAIALRELGPVTLVMTRLLLASATLLVFVGIRGLILPVNVRTIAKLALLGGIASAVPDALVVWGQQSVPSGVTALLNATAPLFTLVGAYFMLQDEYISLWGVVGLLIGLAGVALIASQDLNGAGWTGATFSREAAIVGASALYGMGPVYIRRFLPDLEPSVIAAGQMVCASLLAATGAFIFERPLPALARMSTVSLFAALWIGVLAQGLGFLAYYSLLRTRGAARAATVIYISPIVSVVLGALFLAERLEARVGLGALLVLAGIWLANWPPATTQVARSRKKSTHRRP